MMYHWKESHFHNSNLVSFLISPICFDFSSNKIAYKSPYDSRKDQYDIQLHIQSQVMVFDILQCVAYFTQDVQM